LQADFELWCHQGKNAQQVKEISDKLTQSVQSIGLYKGSEMSSWWLVLRQQGEIAFLINHMDSIAGMNQRPTDQDFFEKHLSLPVL